MKLLAIESSGLTAGCAVIEDGRLLGEYDTNFKKTHSETLLPMTEALLNMLEIKPSDIDAIGLSKGPGSFTGLRIGIATVKGLAMALDIPVVPVPTTAGIAYNLFGTSGLICPIMDARRSQVYTGLYRFEGEKLVKVRDQMAVSVDELCTSLNGLGEPVTFLGDGIDVYRGRIEDLMTNGFSFAPCHLRYQRAAAMGMLAYEYYKEGLSIKGDDLVPEYLRLSQAERELKEKNDGK
ncbi:MAG: tRNA (adenosine(37)-N6)-threonylcarbamoyltransferase complex dimerization subunit type 1 TsaB [Lachnospiraceae bacterium]|nr:tRNA (adenosine(37)-N6)-threonylcarbamoyltransferase complex dimerization subunit type 1 TsaB [Lachnospiraceae bacterium]